ncbi:MAG: MTAP family purine nucleoside phosphorylase [Deltaproteobacteria bacterium]|nr:MTAP family purine nucleoside phosphorylase [Deltaproteobacteria bacterium]
MNPKIAVIARVGAHRPFEAAGLEQLGVQVLETPYGPSRPLHFFRHKGLEFALLSRHGEAGYEISAPFLNAKANLYALKALGIQKILAWVAPGSLQEELAPGDLVIPHDVLDEGRGGPHTFFTGVGWGFIRHNPLFCPEMRASLLESLQGVPFKVHPQGVYVATTGPRLETAAEIRKFRVLGGDLVGQTLVPEVFLARELEFCYAALTYVVNYAEGLLNRPYQPGVLFEGLATPEEMAKVSALEAAFPELILKVLPALAAAPRACPCPRLLERYRLRGDIGEDWRTWVR